MKKITNIKNHPIIIDTETLDITPLKEKTRGVDSVYIIPEDAEMHWTSDDGEPIDTTVEKGDILVTFYDYNLGKRFTVVKSDDWKGMLERADEIIQKRKEQWAIGASDDSDAQEPASIH